MGGVVDGVDALGVVLAGNSAMFDVRVLIGREALRTARIPTPFAAAAVGSQYALAIAGAPRFDALTVLALMKKGALLVSAAGALAASVDTLFILTVAVALLEALHASSTVADVSQEVSWTHRRSSHL